MFLFCRETLALPMYISVGALVENASADALCERSTANESNVVNNVAFNVNVLYLKTDDSVTVNGPNLIVKIILCLDSHSRMN